MSKKTRFEVLKRDSFVCQYCGVSAPETVLHIDHINPVSKGGDNNIMNLITACESCNLGKKHRKLSDNSSLMKQKSQLDELEAKREQIALMAKWRSELSDITNYTTDLIIAEIKKKFGEGYSVSERGKLVARGWLNKYNLKEIFDAIDRASLQYLKTIDSVTVEKFFSYVPRIAAAEKRFRKEPYLREISKMAGCLVKKFGGKFWHYNDCLKKAYSNGKKCNLDDCEINENLWITINESDRSWIWVEKMEDLYNGYI